MSNPCKILIIEDSIVSAMLMEAQIARKQPAFMVRIRKSMRGGREEFATFNPDVVIMDLQLPDSAPEESIAEIPHFREHARVIATTGYADLEAACRAAGADDFMLKTIGEDAQPFISRILRLCPVCPS